MDGRRGYSDEDAADEEPAPPPQSPERDRDDERRGREQAVQVAHVARREDERVEPHRHELEEECEGYEPEEHDGRAAGRADDDVRERRDEEVEEDVDRKSV